jgi:thiol-disulfide isomerase/thioredoxin
MIAAGPAAKRPPHMLLVVLDLVGNGSLALMILKKTAFLGSMLAFGLFVTTPLSVMVPVAALADGASPGTSEIGPGNFSPFDPPLPAPIENFEDALGGKVHLADFRGKVVVLNFWASWCPPCVAEMPTLDQLQANFGAADLAVIAISLDREGIKKAAPFYRNTGIRNLKLYTDRLGDLFHELEGAALPTTFILDREGRVVAVYVGQADWSGPSVRNMLKKYLETGPAG